MGLLSCAPDWGNRGAISRMRSSGWRGKEEFANQGPPCFAKENVVLVWEMKAVHFLVEPRCAEQEATTVSGLQATM
jgi:hypothetical protein